VSPSKLAKDDLFLGWRLGLESVVLRLHIKSKSNEAGLKVGVGGDNGHERCFLECGIDGFTERSDSRFSDRLA